jgi:hypothetical protein
MSEAATIGITAASIALSILGIFTGGLSLAAAISSVTAVEACVDTGLVIEDVADSAVDALDGISLPRLFGDYEENTDSLAGMTRKVSNGVKKVKVFNSATSFGRSNVSVGRNIAKLVAQGKNHVAKAASDDLGYLSLGLSFLTLPTTIGTDIYDFSTNGISNYYRFGWRYLVASGTKVTNRLLGTSGKFVKAVSDANPERKTLADDATYINFASGVLGQGLAIYGIWNYGEWQSGSLGKGMQLFHTRRVGRIDDSAIDIDSYP